MNNYCFKSSDGSPEDFEELFYAAIVAFDVEATGVNTSTSLPYGFSLSHKPGTAYYTAIETDFFRKLLVAGGKLCIAHNAKYEIGRASCRERV